MLSLYLLLYYILYKFSETWFQGGILFHLALDECFGVSFATDYLGCWAVSAANLQPCGLLKQGFQWTFQTLAVVRKLDLYFCQESYWLRSHSCRALCYVHTMPVGRGFMKSGKVDNFFFHLPTLSTLCFYGRSYLFYFLFVYVFFSIAMSQLYSFFNCAVGWHEAQCHLKSK